MLKPRRIKINKKKAEIKSVLLDLISTLETLQDSGKHFGHVAIDDTLMIRTHHCP